MHQVSALNKPWRMDMIRVKQRNQTQVFQNYNFLRLLSIISEAVYNNYSYTNISKSICLAIYKRLKKNMNNLVINIDHFN